MRAIDSASLLRRGQDGEWHFGPGVRGLSDDSRQVGPGEIFVAVRGGRDDGHHHLGEAAARGAVAAVVETPAPADAPPSLPLIAVTNTRRALAELASAWYGHPSRSLRLIGVTGTNGKTTCALMIVAILTASGLRARALGTLGPFPAHDGYPLTTPFPLQLERTLRHFVDAGVEAVALEVSSHALTQHRVGASEFDAAVLTSLGRDHLDYHGTLKAYWAAKTRLFKDLGRTPRHKTTPTVAILPAEGAGPAAVRRHVRVPCRTFAIGADAEAEVDVVARDVRPTRWGSRFVLVHRGREQAVRIHLPGRMNVENALAAAATALALGVGPESVAGGLDRLRRVPGRLERLSLPGGGFAVVDYAHNPDALEQLLRAVRAAHPGRRLALVLGGRGHRDRGKLPGMGAVAALYADLLVLTEDSPLDEDPRVLAAAIASGVPGTSALPVEFVAGREAALTRAIDRVGPGGLVVVTGRGHERRQWLGERVVDRTDAEMVRHAARAAVAAVAPTPPTTAARMPARRPRPGR